MMEGGVRSDFVPPNLFRAIKRQGALSISVEIFHEAEPPNTNKATLHRNIWSPAFDK